MSLQNSRQVSDIKIMLKQGPKGASIVRIEKAFSEGLVDTYTIYMSDGTIHSFTVTNGNGIDKIEKTATSGLVDTYTITYQNGDTDTFQVTNGNGIASVAKTGSSGLVDTYTITFDNGQTSTFTVTNGENGQDASLVNLAPIEETSTASRAYEYGSHVIYNGLYYVVTQAISQGGTLSPGFNMTQVSVGSEEQAITEAQFNVEYNLINKTTVINKNASGDTTSIVETGSNAVATTTFVKSGSTTTVTTQVVPSFGSYNYTKTATIVTASNSVTVTEAYTRTAKA